LNKLIAFAFAFALASCQQPLRSAKAGEGDYNYEVCGPLMQAYGKALSEAVKSGTATDGIPDKTLEKGSVKCMEARRKALYEAVKKQFPIKEVAAVDVVYSVDDYGRSTKDTGKIGFHTPMGKGYMICRYQFRQEIKFSKCRTVRPSIE
jgi:hypothetical protein